MNSLKLIITNKRYLSVVWVFCSLNIMIGTWVLYIPQVKEKLQLNDGQIGFALFCLALGLLFFIPIAPVVTKKIGLGKTTFLGICIFSIAFLGPLLANSYTLLCMALFLVGSFSGLTDIAMNTLVSEIEKNDKVNFMSSAHGFFSLGGAIGALTGTILLNVISIPLYHMLLMTSFVILSNLLWVKYYFNTTETAVEKQEGKHPFKYFKPLFILAFLAMIVWVTKGR